MTISPERIEAGADAISAAMDALPERPLLDGEDIFTRAELCAFAAAAIEAADRAAWQPIETAPKHATLLDLWCPDSHAYAVRGRFWEQDGQWLDECCTRVLHPRAWRLLPAAPEEQ